MSLQYELMKCNSKAFKGPQKYSAQANAIKKKPTKRTDFFICDPNNQVVKFQDLARRPEGCGF